MAIGVKLCLGVPPDMSLCVLKYNSIYKALDMKGKALDMKGKALDMKGKALDMKGKALDLKGKALDNPTISSCTCTT